MSEKISLDSSESLSWIYETYRCIAPDMEYVR